MICKTCKAEVPDSMVALECQACTDRRLSKGYDDYQLAFLRMVHEGRYQLITHRVPRDKTHIQKYGVRMAYCGKVIVPIAKFKAYVPYSEDELDRVCPACAAAVRAAMVEALAQVPQGGSPE